MLPCGPRAKCARKKDRRYRHSPYAPPKPRALRIPRICPATPTSPWIRPPSAKSTKDIRSRGRHNRRPPKARPTDSAPDHVRSGRNVRRRTAVYPEVVYPRNLDAPEFKQDSKANYLIYIDDRFHSLSHTPANPPPSDPLFHRPPNNDGHSSQTPPRPMWTIPFVTQTPLPAPPPFRDLFRFSCFTQR